MGPFLSKSDSGLVAFSAAALAFAAVLFAPQVLNDGDTYWHVMAGRWMLENRAILRIDPFSYTFAGHPWQTDEWLAEVVMALAYIGAGWNGIVLLFGAAAALTAGLLARHLSRWLGGLSLVATVALALLCAAGCLLARPQLLALPLLEIFTAGLVFARREHRAPSWKLLPVLVLWANVHGSFLVGLGLTAAFFLGAAFEGSDHRGPPVKRWVLFAVASLLAVLVTPHGVEGLILPFKPASLPMGLKEWAATDFSALQPFTIALGTALFVLITRGARVKPLDALVLLGIVLFAAIQRRHHMLAGIVGSLILAEPLAAALANRPSEQWRSVGWRAASAFAVAVVLLVAVRVYQPKERGDDARTPATALAHVPAALAHTPVLNDFGFGGYLIFNDIRPFIDSRAGLYGDAFLRRYVRMMGPDGALLEATLARYHIRWTILSTDNPAVFAMDSISGWRRLYADRWAVVHVRADN